jgi:Transcriptional regulatory protein, C terminal
VLLPTKRAKALLAYLALHPGKPQARSKLAALLWEDSSDDRALASLRQTLSALRKAAAAAGGDLLINRGVKSHPTATPRFASKNDPSDGAETGGAEPQIAEQSRSWRAAIGEREVMRGS